MFIAHSAGAWLFIRAHELIAPHNNPIDTSENIISIIQRKWRLELLPEKKKKKNSPDV